MIRSVNLSSVKKIIVLGFLFVCLSLIALIGLTHYNVNQKNQLDHEVLITIEPGTSFNRFTKKLQNKNVIETRFWLRNYIRINKQYADIKAGTYLLKPTQTLHEILAMVVKGDEHQYSITFVEGTSIKEWLELLAKTENIVHLISKTLTDGETNKFSVSYLNNHQKEKELRLLAKQFNIDAPSPEGYFYPETYSFSAGDTDLAILQRAHNKMLLELDKLWLKRNPNLPYENKHQALTMASIIEKESGKHAEQDIIASVFLNRLDKNMRLETDPTVIYGLGERYYGDIKFKHLREVNQYNTRKIKGFPLTPIAMPGQRALEAAFFPSSSDYLYFVSNGKGEHVFSKTLKEHNLAVKQYLKTIKK